MAAAHFQVDTRLAKLLGETYRSSEAALKELVDNAWDADATEVGIDLPAAMTDDAVRVSDNGVGMTADQIRGEYLNIASDRRARGGDLTATLRRQVKGRKGIGKFAGLSVATRMRIETTSQGKRSSLTIDKIALSDHYSELEMVPLPITERPARPNERGTVVELSGLDQRLNFPTAERLREILVYEYGRDPEFIIRVNGDALSAEDIPGKAVTDHAKLTEGSSASLTFTVASAKRASKRPGIILKINGKAVGKPQYFGLDDDEEVPPELLKKVYGELDISGVEDMVTADWGAVNENSIAYQMAAERVRKLVKETLQHEHRREMVAQKARLERQISARLAKLPEYRRKYAEDALNRILRRFYGQSDERIAVVADVALDAMEHDVYWEILERINALTRGDVAELAESLEQFGLIDLTNVATQAMRRREFLNALEALVFNEATQEREVHQAIESSLWILGRNYALIASNQTLRVIRDRFADSKRTVTGDRRRPDLLLAQDARDRYLLIEFKRPAHLISRTDVSQAESYRDELIPLLSSASPMSLLLFGRGRVESLDTTLLAPNIEVMSYASLISRARSELDWILQELRSEP